jgi:hypothetical protein
MATATITDVITDINSIFTGINGIKRVFTEAPDTAPSAPGDLPCVIPLVERMDGTAAAFSYQAKTYTIRYLLLVTPTNRGLISAEKACRPFMDSVPDAFFAHVKLNDSTVDHGELNFMEYKAIEYTPGSGIIYVGYEIYFTVTIKSVIDQDS